MTARESMSLPTEFAVCDALIARAVCDDLRISEACILALHELGYEEAASYLDTALASRRELSTNVGDHSVRAPARARAHQALGRCWCGAAHHFADAFALNREILDSGTANGSSADS